MSEPGASTRATSSPQGPGGPRTGHIAALDGLRGVAVLAVVAYHLRPEYVPGGFLGVDLFFVLSGYLITSLLLEERERTGRIDLLAFAGRRIRRLLPAAVLVVVAALAFARFDEFPGLIEQTRRHAIATVAYVANWVFINDGDSYFAEVTGEPLLRHVWSLSIEEQFYLVWPLATWGLYRAGGRRAVAGGAVALAAVSAVWMAVRFEGGDPSRVYFGTDTRIFEPLVGAAGAVLLPLRSTPPQLLARVGALAGVAWVVAVFAIDDRWTGFYEGGALGLAVLALVAVMGATGDGGLSGLLRWRPLVALGAISYGVYLWHWPILIAAKRLEYDGVARDVGVVVLTLFVSLLSYRLVEQPIRRGRGWAAGAVAGWRPVGLAAASVVVVVAGAYAIGDTPSRAGAVSVEEAIAATVGVAAEADAAIEVAETTADAESDESTAASLAAPDDAVADAAAAVVDPGPIEVALIGDSTAWSLGGGFIGFTEQHGPYVSPFDPERITLLNLARKGYRLVDGATIDVGGVRARPPVDAESEQWWRETIEQATPDVVVALFGLADLQGRRIDEQDVPFGSAEFDEIASAAAANLFADLADVAPIVVLTIPPYVAADMPEPGLADFFRDQVVERAAHLDGLFADLASDDQRVRVVDLSRWLCPGDDGAGFEHGCRTAPDGQPVRPDGIHFDEAGGELVAGWLTGELEALGLAG